MAKENKTSLPPPKNRMPFVMKCRYCITCCQYPSDIIMQAIVKIQEPGHAFLPIFSTAGNFIHAIFVFHFISHVIMFESVSFALLVSINVPSN